MGLGLTVHCNGVGVNSAYSRIQLPWHCNDHRCSMLASERVCAFLYFDAMH